MRILLLTHSFNSLTQRLFGLLRQQAHEVSVELDIADVVTEEAVALFKPDPEFFSHFFVCFEQFLVCFFHFVKRRLIILRCRR